MGLGKTITGAVKSLQYKNKILVVCPKSIIPQWLDTFKMLKEAALNLTKKKQLEQFIGEEFAIGIINYQSVWRRPELLKCKALTLMLDESQNICNPTSKQTKGITKINYENLILLSGSPVSGRYDKLYTQLKMLGLKMNKRQFEDRYCNFFEMEKAGVKFRVLSKTNPYKNVDELKRLMDDLHCVFMKTDEVLELPAQQFIDVPCKSTKQYKEFEKTDYIDLGDKEYIAGSPTDKMLYLRYLASVDNPNKTEQLKTLIDSTDDRLIIFYNFDCEYELLLNACKGRPVSVVNGHKRDLTAYENESNSITLCQTQAANAGLNLQKANKMILYSLPLNCAHYMQLLKRIHRIGTKHRCLYYFLLTENSIDGKIKMSLQQGKDYTEDLFERGD